jgi:hypothetical protein
MKICTPIPGSAILDSDRGALIAKTDGFSAGNLTSVLEYKNRQLSWCLYLQSVGIGVSSSFSRLASSVNFAREEMAF